MIQIGAEPIPGRSGDQTGGQFDGSEWRKEAAAGKGGPQIFVDRFKTGESEGYTLVARGDPSSILKGLEMLPKEDRLAVLQTVLAFHEVKPKYLSADELKQIISVKQRLQEEAAVGGRTFSLVEQARLIGKAKQKGAFTPLASSLPEVKPVTPPVAPTPPTPKV